MSLAKFSNSSLPSTFKTPRFMRHRTWLFRVGPVNGNNLILKSNQHLDISFKARGKSQFPSNIFRKAKQIPEMQIISSPCAPYIIVHQSFHPWAVHRETWGLISSRSLLTRSDLNIIWVTTSTVFERNCCKTWHGLFSSCICWVVQGACRGQSWLPVLRLYIGQPLFKQFDTTT